MKQHLNSLLIEGRINSDVELAEAGIVKFSILNNYLYYGEDGKEKNKTLSLTVQVHGELARKAFKDLKNGMYVRLVGRLTMDSDHLEMIAKHIEYRKPKSTKLSAIYEEDEE